MFFTLSTFSDKGNGKLALICELMDMNLYEMIRGMEALYNIVNMLFYMSFATKAYIHCICLSEFFICFQA